MDEEQDEVLDLSAIAALLGLNSSTPRVWINSGQLPAHKDPSGRKWLVFRRDLDGFLSSASRPDVGRPRGRVAVEQTTREDWSDAPEQASFDLISSVKLPGGRR